MLLTIIKILGMLYPFIKEAYLNKNKYKRNKTIILMTIAAIIMMLVMTAAIDSTYTLYKQNKISQDELSKLKVQYGNRSDMCDGLTKSIEELNIKVANLIDKQNKK